MGERKVLNKYFPADFDPSKIPRRKFDYDAPQDIRMMLPFSMCCLSCGHYMYQGKKFNSKKETAKGMDYLGVKRLRFTIKCEVCSGKITFLTDPKNQDYECESGASRNFAAWRDTGDDHNKTLVEKEEPKEKTSMEVLEERAISSKKELDIMEQLEKTLKRNSRADVSRLDVLDVSKRKNAEKELEEDEIEKETQLAMEKRKKELKMISEPDSVESKKRKLIQEQDVDQIDDDDEEEEGLLKVRKKKKKKKKKKAKSKIS
mmetsp:Transcript_8987/g.10775  ORF Transcript_8987/g.10775 Transcript_8987/m.10775 type:complete len:260 (+) Transcript_8987:140-919(+)|eukprot:CAMPEP_0184032820 /NCGR_PEP_ID=MMETSP0955-20130417/3324_1 /TAXON_ID=627963 /ORGANISM="Aplanochytrium sp, Strain PBS07" /LENGTH=259 /DNA_ID=CAMNT_0026319011 /DNA_START=54 /DNA_END=833 /DNA_ORIENTATION=+